VVHCISGEGSRIEGMSCRAMKMSWSAQHQPDSTHRHVDRVDIALVLSLAKAELPKALDNVARDPSSGIDEFLARWLVVGHQTPAQSDGRYSRDGG